MLDKKDCLISIAMATYNGGKYLASQLDSIVQQTYKNIEIVIVDDCSSDNTIEIIEEYQSKYPYIKLFYNQSNQGIVFSFNRAISKCQGGYIALSDQDDIWFSDKLDVLINNIGDNLLIHSDAILINDSGQIICNSHFKAARKRSKVNFIDYLISNNVTGCTTMFSRKLANLALPIPKGFYIHDHYLAIVASFLGSIKLIDKPLVYYRQHEDNSIGATRPSFNAFLSNCKVKADSYNYLLELDLFKDNLDIELLRDYRLSIFFGKWISKFNILRLLSCKHGLKLLIFYILMTGFSNRKISQKIYTYIYKN